MGRKISEKEYEKRLKEATDTIISTSEYLGWNLPMNYRCLVCGNNWTVKEARSVIRGHGCPACGNKKRAAALKILGKKRAKTEDQFRKELSEKQPNLIPNDLYKSKNTKYHCICKIHNCDVFTTPEKYLTRNQGCGLCAIERSKNAIRYTHDSFVKTLSLVNPNLDVLSEYSNVKNRIRVRCKICKYEWTPIAESLIAKIHCGCPNCAGNAIKDPSVFEEELKISHPELKLLSPYVRANRKIHALCTDCNKDFWITPNKLQQGQHCPHCKISYGERLVRDILDKLNVEYEMQKKFDNLKGSGNRNLAYDFYLPGHNLLIEFQGEQHERPVEYFGGEEKFKIQQEHDRRKRDYAKLNNIRLLEIWYYNIDLVEDILLKELYENMFKSA